MKKTVAALTLAALTAAGVQTATAGHDGWSTAGAFFTGVVAGQIITSAIQPVPVYTAAPPVCVQPPPVVVYRPPIYVQPVPVLAPRFYLAPPPVVSFHGGYGYHRGYHGHHRSHR